MTNLEMRTKLLAAREALNALPNPTHNLAEKSLLNGALFLIDQCTDELEHRLSIEVQS